MGLKNENKLLLVFFVLLFRCIVDDHFFPTQYWWGFLYADYDLSCDSYCNIIPWLWTAGKCFTLLDAVKSLLPEFFAEPSLTHEEISEVEVGAEQRLPSEEYGSSPRTTTADVGETSCEHVWSSDVLDTTEIKLLRIQGIEPKLEIPFVWVVNNLMNPEHFLHICVYVRIPEPITI